MFLPFVTEGAKLIFPILDPQMGTIIDQQIMTGEAVNLAVEKPHPALFRNRYRLEFVSSIGWRVGLIVWVGFGKKTDRHAAGDGFCKYIVMA